MTNYLLSIDPSIKNTGFTLGEYNEDNHDCSNDFNETRNYCECDEDNIIHELGKPILISSYSFQKYSTGVEISKSDYIYNNNFNYLIINQIEKELDFQLGSKNSKSNFNLIIERGFPNMKGSETQDHLRGFITGQFNKLLTKDMLISPKEGQNGYKNRPLGVYGDIKNEKGNKETSLAIAQIIINENNGNITISNHDEADSLLIGGYYLNKENK